MIYVEFNKYEAYKDKAHPLTNAYKNDVGDTFYVEPGFYTGLMGYRDKAYERLPLILEKIDEFVRKNHNVVFTADFENPMVDLEGYIYCEIEDITNPLGLTWIDDSRPSDYGD